MAVLGSLLSLAFLTSSIHGAPTADLDAREVAIPPESPQGPNDMPIVTCPTNSAGTSTELFSVNEVFNALSGACYYAGQNGTGDVGNVWPQNFVNYYNLQLVSGSASPYLQFPLIPDAVYVAGDTGNYRVIADNNCKLAGVTSNVPGVGLRACTLNYDTGLQTTTAAPVQVPTTTARPATAAPTGGLTIGVPGVGTITIPGINVPGVTPIPGGVSISGFGSIVLPTAVPSFGSVPGFQFPSSQPYGISTTWNFGSGFPAGPTAAPSFGFGGGDWDGEDYDFGDFGGGSYGGNGGFGGGRGGGGRGGGYGYGDEDED